MTNLILKYSWVFAILCCIASGYFGFLDLLYGLQQRLVSNIQFIVAPFEFKNKLSGRFELLQARINETFPDIVKHSNSHIGYFGYIPFPMVFLANKYTPMPVYTSFAASTFPLSDLNSNKYEKLPEFLLVNYSTIDGRYIQQDDPWQQYYIARNFVFNKMTEYGALLERVKSKGPYRLINLTPPVQCSVPCAVSIPKDKSIVVKFMPYDSNMLSRIIFPYFRLRLDFEDRVSDEFRMSYSSAQIGLFANVLSLKYAYPHLITPDDSRIVRATISCSPTFVCPTAIQYSLEEIFYDD